jgi:hypothetical protein
MVVQMYTKNLIQIKCALKSLKLTNIAEIMVLGDDVDSLICKENTYIPTQRYS